MDSEMFSGFGDVVMPKDSNMIAEPARVMVMVPGTRAAKAEGALAQLKSIVISVCVIVVLCVCAYAYFVFRQKATQYEGKVLPGIYVQEKPKVVKTEAAKLEQPELKRELKAEIKAADKENEIVHIIGEIPTWAEDETSDDIDKRVTDTDDLIIQKMKSRELFLKDLGNTVASSTRTN